MKGAGVPTTATAAEFKRKSLLQSLRAHGVPWEAALVALNQ